MNAHELAALRVDVLQARELLGRALDAIEERLDAPGSAATVAAVDLDPEVLNGVVRLALRDHAAAHDGEGATIGDLEELVGAPRVRVLKAIEKLIAAGIVCKRGVRRGTRYHLAGLAREIEDAADSDLVEAMTEPPPPDLGALVEADSYAEAGA